MRIRVWHILLIFILAGVAWSGYVPSFDRLMPMAEKAWAEIQSLIGLVKSGEESDIQLEAKPPAPEPSVVAPSTAPAQIAVSTPPAAPPAVKKPAPAKKKKTVRKRKAAPKKKRTVTKKTGPQDRYSKFVGSYVVMSLTSGSAVKGVYLGRSGNSIKLDIPGLGPFDYPAAEVSGMQAAE